MLITDLLLILLRGGTSAPATNPTSSSGVIATATPDNAPKTRGVPKPEASVCPGYYLELPAGQSPYTSYAFQIHAIQVLPWSLKIDHDNRLMLHSKQCSGVAKTSLKGKEAAPLPCTSCANLQNHAIILGIRHRALDGAHESTPWSFLTAGQMLSLLRRKTHIINRLKLQALNAARKIGVRNRHLAAWKRLSMAIGREDIPRIRSLMATQSRAGASVFTMLEKIDQAARRVYSPRGYQITDFQRAYLIYKLGGRAAANIAHKSLGIPSIDATKHHIMTAPLQSSSGFPTTTELKSNLSICYPPCFSSDSTSGEAQKIQGMIIAVDELKVQERLRWDPRSNHILGVCREHGSRLGASALEFRSIIQADAVLTGLKDKFIHFATEVC